MSPGVLSALGLRLAGPGEVPSDVRGEMREVRGDAPGLHLRLADPQSAALSLHRTPAALTALAGFLDEPEDAAAAAGLPAQSPPAEVAAATLLRHGAETPNRLLGEWTLLHWHFASRTATLVGSAARRDRLYCVYAGGLLLLAPDPLSLARLAPGGPVLSPLGLLREHARAPLRLRADEQTLWQHVGVLGPGTLLRWTASGCERLQAAPPQPPAPWQGSFEEAVEQLDLLGRRVVGQHLGRYPRVAFLLSGGQDSTLLSSWGASERGAHPAPLALCSAAPPGSGLPDESRQSHGTAQHLQLSWQAVWPPPTTDLFRPDPALFRWAASPLIGNRAALYDALRQRALAGGASVLFDGAWGEGSISGGQHRASRPGLKARLHALLWPAPPAGAAPVWPVDAFLAQFSPDLLALAPARWRDLMEAGEEMRQPAASSDVARHPGTIGLGDVLARSASQGTGERGGLRHLYPFRDRRLVFTAAALPRAFQVHAGVSRALSLAILSRHVPQPARPVQRSRPFSPDFSLQLQQQAPAAATRLADYRAAGLAAWLDLEWLAGSLHRLAREPHPPIDLAYRTQQTAITAEFLLWAKLACS